MTDFERDESLNDLTSEELEEQAFGPDPSARRPKRKRRRRRKEPRVLPAAPSPVSAAPVTLFCYACGAEVDARAEICPSCGVRQPDLRALQGHGEKSKGAATLLALFLGGVGGHRFYLGQTKLGLAMLLFCWTMIPFVIGVVDAFRYVLMTDRRFAALYEPEPATLSLPPRPVRRISPGPARGRAVDEAEKTGPA